MTNAVDLSIDLSADHTSDLTVDFSADHTSDLSVDNSADLSIGPASIPLPALYTPKDVAELLGLSRRRIYDWLNKGWLRGHRKGGRWVITPQDLDIFKRTCVGSHGRLLPSVYEWAPIWKAHL